MFPAPQMPGPGSLAQYGAGDCETREASFVYQSPNKIAMSKLFRFPSSERRDPAIEVWMHEHSGEWGAIVQRWFEVIRNCGDEGQHDDLVFAVANPSSNEASTSRIRSIGVPLTF